MKPIKEFISDYIFTKTVIKKINAKRITREWFEINNFIEYYNLIHEMTSFLKQDASLPERIYCIFNDITSPVLCFCGKQPNFKSYIDGYYTYCSKYCSTQSEERNQKIRENHDYQAVLAKVKETNLKKYGTESFFQTDKFKEKAKQTKIERYGTPNYFNQEKARLTMMEKYGVTHNNFVEECKKKRKEKARLRHPELHDPIWLAEQNKTKSITEIAESINVTYAAVYQAFKREHLEIDFHKKECTSQEFQVCDFVKTIYDGKILQNKRNIIKPLELDIFLPDKNLAIEYNGMHWHSNDPDRHSRKLKKCNELNIRLLQFWDYEWIKKKHIVKSIISKNINPVHNILPQVTFKTLTKEEYRILTKQYNILYQENYKHTTNKAMMIGDKVVSIIGLKQMLPNEYNIINFCNNPTTNYLNTFKVMLDHVIDSLPIKKLVFKIDNRLFSGKSLRNYGFKNTSTKSGDYFYFKCLRVISSKEFENNPEKYPSMWWRKIYDCSKTEYTLEVS